MEITRMVLAGSLESNDVLITLKPNEEKKVELVIESIVEKQFLDRIEKVIREILTAYQVTGGLVHIQDRGALDCTLKARMETAILRVKEGM